MKSFQTYQDPEEQISATTPMSGEGEDVVLPLDDNILTCNLGIPLVVVCTKVSRLVLYTSPIIDMLSD